MTDLQAKHVVAELHEFLQHLQTLKFTDSSDVTRLHNDAHRLQNDVTKLEAYLRHVRNERSGKL